MKYGLLLGLALLSFDIADALYKPQLSENSYLTQNPSPYGVEYSRTETQIERIEAKIKGLEKERSNLPGQQNKSKRNRIGKQISKLQEDLKKLQAELADIKANSRKTTTLLSSKNNTTIKTRKSAEEMKKDADQAVENMNKHRQWSDNLASMSSENEILASEYEQLAKNAEVMFKKFENSLNNQQYRSLRLADLGTVQLRLNDREGAKECYNFVAAVKYKADNLYYQLMANRFKSDVSLLKKVSDYQTFVSENYKKKAEENGFSSNSLTKSGNGERNYSLTEYNRGNGFNETTGRELVRRNSSSAIVPYGNRENRDNSSAGNKENYSLTEYGKGLIRRNSSSEIVPYNNGVDSRIRMFMDSNSRK